MAENNVEKRPREDEDGGGSNKAAVRESEHHPMATLLGDCGQEHILAAVAEADRDELYAQVAALDKNYPTGLRGYVDNARKLLTSSSSGANPMADVVRVEVPTGKNLVFGSDEYAALEELGAAEISNTCFVLVAGGLGERLGYSGIKLSLPIDVASEVQYLGLYFTSVLALQAKAADELQQAVQIPLVIMTSDDTHARTTALLAENGNFGMAPEQVVLLKQEKVAALGSNSAAMVLADSGKTLLTKPHGHGDVHLLLHQSGTVEAWLEQGKKWAVFFQDTNGLVFRSMLAVLGVSQSLGLDLNSMCVPRMAKQEIGAITKLVYNDGRALTANTEYNQLDPLLKALGSEEGDVADATGFSPYPGNINQLVVALGSYGKVLAQTQGVMEEFVNPKYENEARVLFKKPTRLECMMQDYAKVLPTDAKVGFTTNEPWLGYSPAKNSIAEGLNKIKTGVSPMCPATAEADMYNVHAECWRRHGANVGATTERVFSGIPVSFGPLLSIAPHFAMAWKDLATSLPSPSQVSISSRSSLVISGEGTVVIESLELDGALEIQTVAGARVIVRGLVVTNQGWELVALSEEDMAAAREELRIRGYRLEKWETEILDCTSPGEHVRGNHLGNDGPEGGEHVRGSAGGT